MENGYLMLFLVNFQRKAGISNMKTHIRTQIQDSLIVKQHILNDENFLALIEDACQLCIDSYKHGHRLFTAGNGGSAADAQHIAAELVSRFYFDRPGLAAEALTVNTSSLTAIGNDYAYARIFARQLEANGQAGDVFFAISTSGNSENILEAIHTARTKSIKVIGFTGKTGGKMADLCDICFKVPSTDTPRVQEAHILIAHIICAIIEESLFKREA
jgi:D-sedoheptulose 7-phosphate isomerase